MPWSVQYEHGGMVDAIPMRNKMARRIIGAGGGSLDCFADVAIYQWSLLREAGVEILLGLGTIKGTLIPAHT